MKLKNNHVLIDIGRHGSYFYEKNINGKKFMYDTTYNGGEYLRRSGLVLGVPNDFVYTIPLNIEHKLSYIRVKKGDTVFFDFKAFQYCEKNNLIDKTTEGNTIYLMPYRFLICAIQKETGIVQMLNGRVLVKMRDDLTNSNTITQPETNRREPIYRYAEITHVDNNEGYAGISYDMYSYNHMGYSKQQLNVGDIVVINKHADFDLQSIFQEVSTHVELEKSFVVHRSEIVCFKTSEELDFDAWGLYVKLEPIDRDYMISEHITLSKDKVLKSNQGKVLSMGNGICDCQIGSIIFIKAKSEIEIEGSLYVHVLWILLN